MFNHISEWYNVDGIFLDEMGNSLGGLDYVAVYDAIKGLAASLGIDLHVVGNPGIPFSQVEAYLAAADTLCIFEGPLTNSDPNGASLQKFYPEQGTLCRIALSLVRELSTRCQLRQHRFSRARTLVHDAP